MVNEKNDQETFKYYDLVVDVNENDGQYWDVLGCNWAVLDCTGFYWALLGRAGGAGDPCDPGGRDVQPG